MPTCPLPGQTGCGVWLRWGAWRISSSRCHRSEPSLGTERSSRASRGRSRGRAQWPSEASGPPRTQTSDTREYSQSPWGESCRTLPPLPEQIIIKL